MYTLIQAVSQHFWGSIIVGLLGIVGGGVALIGVLTGQLHSSAPLRYLIFGGMGVFLGVSSLKNAARLRNNAHVK